MTTGAADSVFVDTNVLVYRAISQAPLHTEAITAMEARYNAGLRLWTSRQVLGEYLADLSRPQPFTNPLPAPVLVSDVRQFESRFRVAEDSPAVTARLLDLLQQFTVGGKQVHDANIVATMLVHGIPRLLTANAADFMRFSSVIAVEPLAP